MKNLLLLPFFILFFQCKEQKKDSIETKTESIFELSTSLNVIKENDGIKIISGGKEQVFKTEDLPLKNVVCLPTSAIAYMDALDLTDKIKGIAEPNYIYNKTIHDLIENKKIKQVGTANDLFLEELYVMQPDLVISTTNPALSKFHEQLESNNIPVIYLDEYLEKTPLAKAELIKLFGVLFNKETQANQLFNKVKTNYNELKQLASTSKHLPLVMAGVIYGDIWYAPGGNSFPAQFFKDAGANYIWSDKNNSESLKLSFEEVYEQSEETQFWLNAADFTTMKSLKSSYPNYEWLKPFKDKQVYSFSATRNETGANDYFETGVVRPDWVLKDLIAILHPELMNDSLKFYHHLN